MQPFAIHCTTCRARLVVRDPAAIGQILACPRCASMVLVEPPAGMPAPQASATGTTQQVVRPRTATPHPPRQDALGIADTVPDSFAGLDELLADRPARESAAASNASSTARHSELPVAAAGSQPPSDEHAARGGEPPVPIMPPPVEAMSAEALPPPHAAIATVARWSPTTIVLVAGIFGVVLAVSAALLLIAGFGGKRSEVAVVVPSDDAGQGDGQKVEDGGPSAVSPGSTPPSDAPPNDENSTPPVAPPVNKSKSPPGTVDDQNPAVAKPDKPDKPAADTLPVVPKPAAKTDTAVGTSEPEFKPKPGEIRRPLPALGGKFADVLNNTPLELVPRPGDPNDLPPRPENGDAKPEVPADEPAPGRAALPRPLARDIDLPARLADRLAGVVYQEVPLLDFVYEISDLSTIPITLDLQALRLRQLSAAAPVSAKLADCSVAEILEAALAPLKLVARPTADSGLVVTLPDGEGAIRKADYPIEDLTAGEEGRTDLLLEWLTALAAPETWTVNGGTATLAVDAGQLTIEGPEASHLESLFLLEKLRAARKLPPQAKPPYAAGLLSPDAVGQRGADKLALPLKLNFGRPTRLTTILRRLSRDTGTQIVPNWQSLATIGWTTETQATVTVDGKSLAETLAALLEPMELTYRVIDATTVEVLAQRSAWATLDVELHSTGDLAQGDAEGLLRRLETELGAERFAAQGGTASLRYDGVSQCVIAAGPYDLQRRLSQTLASWRK